MYKSPNELHFEQEERVLRQLDNIIYNLKSCISEELVESRKSYMKLALEILRIQKEEILEEMGVSKEVD